MIKQKQRSIGIGSILFFGAATTLGVYFVFAAIQGDYGHFKRIQIEAEHQVLAQEFAMLRKERARLENLTKRLSDDYLDLDLLDEQARRRLGYARTDEIIIR